MMHLMLPVVLGLAPALLERGRSIEQFDFEEAQLRPLTMPLAFEQIGDPGTGSDFPRFGGMSLTEENPHSGRFAFRFDLKGRSMAARTLPGTLPIQPLVDHRISVQVRTSSLERAGVRLVAWLVDVAGSELETTRSVSRVLSDSGDDDDQWHTLSVTVPGVDQAAAELVIELQLVQPDLQSNVDTGRPLTRPSIEDISGVAVFDDVTVEQWPRLYLADASRIGLHAQRSPVLHLRIDDPAHGDAHWHLNVMDSTGQVVHEQSGDVPAHGLDETLTLPLTKRDWYTVQTTITEQNRVLLEDELAFALLNDLDRHRPEPRICLDLTGSESNHGQAELAIDLLGHLGPGEAIVPMWHADVPFRTSWPDTMKHVDELKRLDIQPTLALNWIPPDQRSKGPFDPRDAARFLATHPDTLDETVQAALIAWGDTASHWRIGRIEDNANDLASAEAALLGRLDGFVIDLAINTADSEVLREQDAVTPREQMRTNAISLVTDWCDGTDTILIAAPWRPGTRGMEPTATYPILQTMIDALSGRSTIARLPAGPELEARLLEGTDRDSIVIAWRTEQISFEDSGSLLRLPLDAARIECRDALGNSVTPRPRQNDVAIPIGDLPVIIRNFDASLMRLPTRCAIEPGRLEASMQVHDHELAIENTLPGSMQGQLIVKAPEGVTIRPSVIGLDLPPGGTLRMPIEIVVTTPLAGRPLEVNLEARLDSGRRVPMNTWLDVSLPDLEIQWTRRDEPDSDDLLIDLEIRNLRNASRRLKATLGHHELEMLRPATLRVEADGTMTQTFRIPAGCRTLAGESISLMLEDPESQCRLRDMLDIPGISQTVQVETP